MHTDKSILPGSCTIKFIAGSIPCLLVLYSMSIGPVAKLEDFGMIGERTGNMLNVVYAPLSLVESIPGTRLLFSWYVFHVWNCDTMGDNTL